MGSKMRKSDKNNYDKNLRKQNIILVTLIVLLVLFLGAIFLTKTNTEGLESLLFIFIIFLVIVFLITFFKKKTNKFLRLGLYLIYLDIFSWTLQYILTLIFNIPISSTQFVLFFIILSNIGLILIPVSIILIFIGLLYRSDNSESISRKQQPIQTK